MVFQQILNGLTNGSIYALLAIGVTMIYKSLGMLNFAHGDTVMISAFICLTLITAGIPIPLAIVLTIIAAAFIGCCLERFIYRKLEFSSFTNLLIATVGVSYIMKNLAIVVWGAEPQVFPALFSTEPINLGKLLLLPQNIGIICVAACLVVVLQLFFYKTKTGKQMRAAATDSEGASMMGINVNKCRLVTFGISAAFAAIAGILLSPIFYVSVDMGTLVGLKAFSAAILGGFGNIVGAMLGGIILGIVEALGATYATAAYKDIISFVLLFLFLYFKPNGILGKRIEQKL